MDIQAAKIELAKTILETESASLIEKIQELVSNEYGLSNDQMRAIDEALAQVERGETVSHEVVNENMHKHYPKYFK
ncbi:hypothetical protein GR160_06435 [Flavobacterium sp. Sd200]|uniref:hypothetical protein n=1 Tax=Flavobacterium sp. Sd200 TaxID=2692211 RepID=UPI00136BDECD|nr:hypothetical protein [Flavobacterium sp. Sd200]MXN90860.1 hypothetical protein [Flavobacterium sp. Sd200]